MSHDNTRLKYVLQLGEFTKCQKVASCAMAYPQMESAGDAGLLPMPGDASYPPTAGAAYPPPAGYDHGG